MACPVKTSYLSWQHIQLCIPRETFDASAMLRLVAQLNAGWVSGFEASSLAVDELDDDARIKRRMLGREGKG
ncbi:hypothetical protein CIHG_06179 [Coccidioides immitis H538.4]|uniref:Uncharacterized protein n=1 Tax=Coccidioides immitis H538.4 TaxID=396776 RepID=A0A0J8RV00_COCIT|nr:hypothetical protein CIHG_06179 [Coccidioides immitis H538.4]